MPPIASQDYGPGKVLSYAHLEMPHLFGYLYTNRSSQISTSFPLYAPDLNRSVRFEGSEREQV